MYLLKVETQNNQNQINKITDSTQSLNIEYINNNDNKGNGCIHQNIFDIDNNTLISICNSSKSFQSCDDENHNDKNSHDFRINNNPLVLTSSITFRDVNNNFNSSVSISSKSLKDEIHNNGIPLESTSSNSFKEAKNKYINVNYNFIKSTSKFLNSNSSSSKSTKDENLININNNNNNNNNVYNNINVNNINLNYVNVNNNNHNEQNDKERNIQSNNSQIFNYLTFYEEYELLGSGATCNVYKAKKISTGKLVALKIFNENFFNVNEIVILKLVKGFKNVIPYENFHSNSIIQQYIIVMPLYMATFYKIIHDRKVTDQGIRFLLKGWVWQLINSVKQLHNAGIMHRDLKTENILLDENGNLIVSDFGLATKFNNKVKYNGEVVTYSYRAPELFLNPDQYGPEIDCWSIGIIIIELLLRNQIFSYSITDISQLELIYSYCGKPDRSISKELSNHIIFSNFPEKFRNIDNRKLVITLKQKTNDINLIKLICGFLDPNPSTRLSCQDALISPYFKMK